MKLETEHSIRLPALAAIMPNVFLASVKGLKEAKKEEEHDAGKVKVEPKLEGPQKKLASDMEKKLKNMPGDVTVVRDACLRL